MTLAVTNGRLVRRRWAFLGAVVVIGGAGGALVLKATLPRTAPVAVAARLHSLKDADGFINEVTPTAGGGVAINVSFKAAPTIPNYVDLAGMTARAVGKALQAGVSDQVAPDGYVQLAYELPLQDDHGRETKAPFMTLDFQAQDLRTIDYANLQWPGVLALAKAVKVADAGLTPVRAWCARPDYVGSRFCAKALAK